MNKQNDLIRKSVIRDMSEGVVVLGLDGTIQTVNPAAEWILGRSAEDLMGRKIATAFYEYSENDPFNQAVLDAVYDPASLHRHLVPFFTGSETRQLRMTTAYLRDGDAPVGIVMVLGDVTELAELKIQYAQQITTLLDSLVTALSTAIDERSPYTANHTRNMVKMGEAFLDWLDATKNPNRFDADRRHAFLMSVWLHDVGKLAVPLSVMDKATRLAGDLERIESRFEKLRLLNRIDMLEGRATQEAYEKPVFPSEVSSALTGARAANWSSTRRKPTRCESSTPNSSRGFPSPPSQKADRIGHQKPRWKRGLEQRDDQIHFVERKIQGLRLAPERLHRQLPHQKARQERQRGSAVLCGGQPSRNH